MSLIIFLDTSPLSILTNPKRPPLTEAALLWAARHLRAGNDLFVPSIADFELRRELIRLGSTRSMMSLDTWNVTPSERYLPLTDSALRLAATLWARARNAGMPTADPKELDGDVLIAAQALDFQSVHGLATDEIIMATGNIGHLSQFLPVDLWQNILP